MTKEQNVSIHLSFKLLQLFHTMRQILTFSSKILNGFTKSVLCRIFLIHKCLVNYTA